MRTTSRRLLRAAVPLVTVPVLLGSLAACSGDDSESASESPSSSTGSPSSTSSSGKTVDTAEFKTLIEHSLDQATTAQIGLELITSGGKLTGKGQVDYTGDDAELAMKLTAQQFGAADLRVVDRTLYVSLPALDKSGSFFKSDLDSPGATAQLGGLSGFDPAASLAALSKSITEVTLVGSEDFDGDQVDHYTFQADGGALPGAEETDAKPVTVDAWFDDQDRLRKTSTAVDAATKVTVTLSDWDSDVDIEAPPASKVKNMPSDGTTE